jgi:hypothetical protein
MEYRLLGNSGLKVPVLSYGTATFGGGGEFFKAWGATDVAEATRLVDICLKPESICSIRRMFTQVGCRRRSWGRQWLGVVIAFLSPRKLRSAPVLGE